jgi:GNAT superfamily N-acetyltransferase
MSELTKERYVESTTNGWVFVARIPNGKIVGLVSIVRIPKLTRIAYSVEDVVVDKKYRGCGIGRGIMQKLIWFAEQTGMERLDLHTSRPIAAKLYESLGFKSRPLAPYRLEL